MYIYIYRIFARVPNSVPLKGFLGLIYPMIGSVVVLGGHDPNFRFMSSPRYELIRKHVLQTIDKKGDKDGAVPLQLVVDTAQKRYGKHKLFPKGRLTNYVRYTKVDLEARQEVKRVPGSGSQRIQRCS